jgi:hypothetical protein
MYDLSAYSQWVIRRFTALFGKGLVEHWTHLHHRHVPEERHQSGEGIGRESMQHSVTMQKTYVDEEKRC